MIGMIKVIYNVGVVITKYIERDKLELRYVYDRYIEIRELKYELMSM